MRMRLSLLFAHDTPGLPDAQFAKLIDVSVDSPRRRGAFQQYKSSSTSHPWRDESRRWTQE